MTLGETIVGLFALVWIVAIIFTLFMTGAFIWLVFKLLILLGGI